MPSALDRLHDGVGDAPRRTARARDEHGELAVERRRSASAQRRRRRVRSAPSASAGVGDDAHAAPVVAAGARLQARRGQPWSRGERAPRPPTSATRGERRAPGGRARRQEPAARGACPARQALGRRARGRTDAVGLQLPSRCAGGVLVVERDDVARRRPGRAGRRGRRRRPSTCAAPARTAASSGPVARTRSSTPRSIAARCVIRASWPAPTMPTRGAAWRWRSRCSCREVLRPADVDVRDEHHAGAPVEQRAHPGEQRVDLLVRHDGDQQPERALVVEQQPALVVAAVTEPGDVGDRRVAASRRRCGTARRRAVASVPSTTTSTFVMRVRPSRLMR